MDIVTIDFGRYPIKWMLIGATLLLSVVLSLGEGGHVKELNRLPRDRDELTSIKNSGIEINGESIVVSMRVEYIYPITLEMHMRLLRVVVVGTGFNVTMNVTDAEQVTRSGGDIVMRFKAPCSGEHRVLLFRSKTLLTTSSGTLQANASSVNCSGENPSTRVCTFNDVCFSAGTMYFMPRYRHTFEKPLMSYDGRDLAVEEPRMSSLDRFMVLKGITKRDKCYIAMYNDTEGNGIPFTYTGMVCASVMEFVRINQFRLYIPVL